MTRDDVRRDYACPKCGAEAGASCRGTKAYRKGRPYQRLSNHTERWALARKSGGRSKLPSAF